MLTIQSKLKNFSLKNKRVLLRADLNVPLHEKKIIHDHRLSSAIPTINLIQQNGGKVILATHIGRPEKNEPNLSTQLLIPWFEQHGYNTVFEGDIDKACHKSFENKNTILLLENMRFFPGEKTGDLAFAQQLAQLGDYYVNDAFGTLHRNDTSVAIVPTLFDKNKQSIGLLVEKELRILNALLHNPKSPFVFVLGGGKLSDKIPLLQYMADNIDTLLLCPAIVFTFLKSMGKPVGKSLVDNTMLDKCKEILSLMQKKGVNVLFPQDYIVAHNTFDGPIVSEAVSANNFSDNNVGITIGPKTVDLFSKEISKAGTIFLNGLMGNVQHKQTLSGAKAIFEAMAQSKGVSIVGGGDSATAAILLEFSNRLDHLSTGGGSTLAYLSGQPLPGLEPFKND